MEDGVSSRWAQWADVVVPRRRRRRRGVRWAARRVAGCWEVEDQRVPSPQEVGVRAEGAREKRGVLLAAWSSGGGCRGFAGGRGSGRGGRHVGACWSVRGSSLSGERAGRRAGRRGRRRGRAARERLWSSCTAGAAVGAEARRRAFRRRRRRRCRAALLRRGGGARRDGVLGVVDQRAVGGAEDEGAAGRGAAVAVELPAPRGSFFSPFALRSLVRRPF